MVRQAGQCLGVILPHVGKGNIVLQVRGIAEVIGVVPGGIKSGVDGLGPF